MNDEQVTELNLIKNNVIDSMNTILEHNIDDFSKSHVMRCGLILESFIESIKDISIKNLFFDIAKDTILQLNKLNNSVAGSLIDVMERKEIIELINRACILKQFNGTDEDITKDWREW